MNHECTPPDSSRMPATFAARIAWSTVEIGTLWRCPECGQDWLAVPGAFMRARWDKIGRIRAVLLARKGKQ